MISSVLSGDIIAYTSLSEKEKGILEHELDNLFTKLQDKYNTYSRIVKGDMIECYIEKPEDSLRLALVYKSRIKSLSIPNKTKNTRINAFNTYGVRIAIGIGQIDRIDRRKGIIDGEAIYLSGRTLTELGSTSDKARITVKNTLFLRSSFERLNEEFDPLISLIDVLINNATSKQCEILYYKLLGESEENISNRLDLAQSTINEHSTKFGWNAIDKAINRFEKVLKGINYDSY